MRRFAPLMLLTFVALPLLGCGKDVDSLARQQVILYNSWAQAVENDAPLEEQEAIRLKVDSLQKTLEGLALSDDDRQRLIEKFGAELNKGHRRLRAALLQKRQEAGLQLSADPIVGQPIDPDAVVEKIHPNLPPLPPIDDIPTADDLPPMVVNPADIDTEEVEAKARDMQAETGALMKGFAEQFRQLDQNNPTEFSPNVQDPSP